MIKLSEFRTRDEIRVNMSMKERREIEIQREEQSVVAYGILTSTSTIARKKEIETIIHNNNNNNLFIQSPIHKIVICIRANVYSLLDWDWDWDWGHSSKKIHLTID